MMKRALAAAAMLAGLTGKGQTRNLDYFIAQAIKSSPLIADLRNRAEAGRLDSQLLRASSGVQVNGVSANYYAPVIRGYGYDAAITNGGQLAAQVQATKSFLSRPNLASQYLAIRLVNEGLLNSAAILEKDLKKTIVAQYVTVYGDGMTQRYARETLQLFAREDSLLRKLTQQNLYRQADYLTFYVTLQQQQTAVSQANLAYENDYATLNYLAGLVDTASSPLEEPALAPIDPFDIAASPLYRQYELDSLSLRNDRKTIDFSYKPKVNAVADAGYVSSWSYQGYRNFGTGFGLNLSVPIYDGRQRAMKYEKLAIAERTRTQARDFFLRQYAQEVLRLQQQVVATRALAAGLEEQLRYQRTLIDVNTKLLGTGDTRIADLVLAMNAYIATQAQLTQNRVASWQLINQLNYWQGL